MASSSYQRGRGAEYQIQKEMEAAGYTTIRAAGSKGKTDVLCWDDEQYIHIQAKSFQKRPGTYTEDLESLRAVPVPYNGSRELWIWQFRKGWWRRIALGSTAAEDAIFELAPPGDEETGGDAQRASYRRRRQRQISSALGLRAFHAETRSRRSCRGLHDVGDTS